MSNITDTMQDIDDVIVTKKHKRKIKINFYVCFLGIFFSFSAFRAVLDLQSSINIQHGLGPASGTTISIMGIVSSFTITPVVLIKLGPKVSLILSEIYYLFYVIANFYPVYATMIPGSILAGMAESLIFPAMSIYSVYFAIEYSNYGSKTKEEYISDFAGKLFGIVYVTHLVGNLLTYLVMRLDSGRGLSNSSVPLLPNNSSEPEATGGVDFSVCGANDCQEPNITLNNLSQYVAEKTTTSVLLSLFCVLVVVAILIHWCATPAIWSDNTVAKTDRKLSSHRHLSNESVDDGEDTQLREARQTGNGEIPDHKIISETDRKCTHPILQLIWQTIRNMSRQLRSPKQLLLMGIQFYTGLELAVVMAEIARAYISCMEGVQKVGLALVAYGAFSSSSAFLSGKVASRFGRNIPFFVAFVVDLSAYIFCIIWEPTEDATWPVYIVSAAFGFTSGVWQTLTNAMCTDYFKDEREIAFTTWNMFICCGISLQFGWSTSMCVDKKLYADIVILCFAVITYALAEIIYQRKSIGPYPPNTFNVMASESICCTRRERANAPRGSTLLKRGGHG